MSVLQSKIFREKVVKALNDTGYTVPGVNTKKNGKRRKLVLADLDKLPRYSMSSS